MKSLIPRLVDLGFEYEEFPDGWFWHLSAHTKEEKVTLATALGLKEALKDGLPDTVVIRADKDGTEWEYFFGDEGGRRSRLEDMEAMYVLDALESGED